MRSSAETVKTIHNNGVRRELRSIIGSHGMQINYDVYQPDTDSYSTEQSSEPDIAFAPGITVGKRVSHNFASELARTHGRRVITLDHPRHLPGGETPLGVKAKTFGSVVVDFCQKSQEPLTVMEYSQAGAYATDWIYEDRENEMNPHVIGISLVAAASVAPQTLGHYLKGGLDEARSHLDRNELPYMRTLGKQGLHMAWHAMRNPRLIVAEAFATARADSRGKLAEMQADGLAMGSMTFEEDGLIPAALSELYLPPNIARRTLPGNHIRFLANPVDQAAVLEVHNEFTDKSKRIAA